MAPKVQQMVFLEMTEKFAEIDFDDLSGYAELTADCVRYARFGVAQFDKLEHARADRVQPEHLALANIEHDGAVLVVRRTDFIRKLQHEKTPAWNFENLLTAVSLSEAAAERH